MGRPGQADDSVTVFLGYGRGRAGRVGTRAGYNGYALRTADRPYFDGGLELVKTGDRYNVASTQTHHTMAGRDLIHSATNARFLKDRTLFRGEENRSTRSPSFRSIPAGSPLVTVGEWRSISMPVSAATRV